MMDDLSAAIFDNKDLNASKSYKASQGFTYLKWIFAFAIASLPILLNFVIAAINSDISIETFWDISGELFIVSIVTVSEPLWELINLEKKMDLYSVILIITKLMFIIFCVSIFTFSLSNKPNNNKPHAQIEKKLVQQNYPTNILSNSRVDSMHSFNVSDQNKTIDTTRSTYIFNESSKIRVIIISFGAFIVALLLGWLSLKHYHRLINK